MRNMTWAKLALAVKNLKDADDVDFACAAAHARSWLEDVEFLLKQVLLLFHLELVHAGLATDGEQLPDG